MQITQEALPLKIVRRCKECGHEIKKGDFGRVCKKKVYAFVIDLFVRTIAKKYWVLIKEFLESEGV